MTTHTEDTKEMTVAELTQTIIDSESFMALDDYKVFLKDILTLYASQVREEERERIIAYLITCKMTIETAYTRREFIPAELIWTIPTNDTSKDTNSPDSISTEKDVYQHTEDTKEMTAETRHMLIVSVRNWDDGTISFLDFEKNVEELLTTYASRVREERDREIVAYCDEQIAHEIGLGGKNSNKQVIETYEYVKEFIKL